MSAVARTATHAIALTPVTVADVARYGADDPLLALLDAQPGAAGGALVMDRWLRDSLPKRYVTWTLYGDLLTTGGRTVFDAGGGLSSLTPLLAARNDYVLAEVGAHHDAAAVRALLAASPRLELLERDWLGCAPGRGYGVAIANDLLPNVDQRLEAFVTDHLPRCDELRLSLTYYERLRYYVTRRIDADEVLTMQAWNGTQTWQALRAALGPALDGLREVFETARESAFPNGRQVVMATVRRLPAAGGAP